MIVKRPRVDATSSKSPSWGTKKSSGASRPESI